jgi:hypothetical protein
MQESEGVNVSVFHECYVIIEDMVPTDGAVGRRFIIGRREFAAPCEY